MKIKWWLINIFLILILLIINAGCTIPVKSIFWEEGSDGFIQFRTNDSDYYDYNFYTWYEESYQQILDVVEIKVKKISGYEWGGFGIVFCLQDDYNFYLLLIDIKGWYTIYEANDSSWIQDVAWTESDMLNKGFSKINTLKVEHDDSSDIFTISINGSYVNSFYDSSFDGGYSGFFVEIWGKDQEDFPDTPVDVRFKPIDFTLHQVVTPTFNPIPGTYTTVPQAVTISTATDGASIRYTIDGSTPTSTVGTLYSGPISIETDTVIKAIAYASGLPESKIAEAYYHFWITFEGNDTNEIHPMDVALDADGRIYIVDYSQSRIVRINDMTGTGWTTFGTSGFGINQFYSPDGIAVDASGRIYVADGYASDRIVRIDDMTGAGWTTLGTPESNHFEDPSGIAFDSIGRIYIADLNNNRIVRIDDMTGSGWTTCGASGYAYYVALDASGRIYIGEPGQIERIDDMNGTGRITFGTYGSGVNQFHSASAIAIDENGRIYVADGGNGRIVRINDMNGNGWTTLGHNGSGIDQFGLNCWGMTVDTRGCIYVADSYNDRIVWTGIK